MGAVVKPDVDWGALPEGRRPIRMLLRRCLERDRTERLHDIAVARLEMMEARRHRFSAGRPARGRSPGCGRGALAAVALVISLMHFRESPPEPQAVKFLLLPPEKARFGALVMSPDGRRVAFTAADAAGKSQLWVRPLDALAASRWPEPRARVFPSGRRTALDRLLRRRQAQEGGGLGRAAAGARERDCRRRGRLESRRGDPFCE